MNEKFANPSPLGLMGFGMTTVLINLHNTGLFELNSMILAMGLFYGGITQIIAGLMEYKRGNTFGVTAFISYGVYWLSLMFLLLMPRWGWENNADSLSMGFYQLIWGVFTFFMFWGTLKNAKVLQFVFVTVDLLFFLLATKEFTGNSHIGYIVGIDGIICGSAAIYLAMGEVLNETYGRTILPIGEFRERKNSTIYVNG